MAKSKNLITVKVTTTPNKSAKNREKQLKKLIQKQMNLANKRIKRLEKNNLTDSPAYQKLVGANGKAIKFGVRGKTYNELQSELARIRQFTNSETSSVRGVNRVLKSIAQSTGIKFKRVGDLRNKTKQFFQIAERVEQYLRNINKSASAIGYQKIWDMVNKYVKDSNTTLGNLENDVEGIASRIYELSAITNIEENVIQANMDFKIL